MKQDADDEYNEKKQIIYDHYFHNATACGGISRPFS